MKFPISSLSPKDILEYGQMVICLLLCENCFFLVCIYRHCFPCEMRQMYQPFTNTRPFIILLFMVVTNNQLLPASLVENLTETFKPILYNQRILKDLNQFMLQLLAIAEIWTILVLKITLRDVLFLHLLPVRSCIY